MKLIRTLTIADFISIVSLILSWTAIYLVLENDPNLAIFVSALAFAFDLLDGFVARRFKVNSRNGLNLDSMIDLVNYIVFSAIFVHKYLSPGITGGVIGIFILTFGVLRLVRTMDTGVIEEDNGKFYQGLISPIIPWVTIGLYALAEIGGITFEYYLLPLYAGLSVAMIFNFKFPKPKNYIFPLLVVVLQIFVSFILEYWI